MKKYVVELTADERASLSELIRKGQAAAYRIRNANVLLKADAGPHGPAWKDARIAEAFGCDITTVERLRKTLVTEGLDAVLTHGNTGSYRQRRLDGKGEAYLIATVCGEPPDGRRRWTLRLLADKLVTLGVVEQCSHMTVQRVLKKRH